MNITDLLGIDLPIIQAPMAGAQGSAMIRELGPINASAPHFPLAIPTMAALRSKCESPGSDDFSPLWCGQNSLACREVLAGARTRELAGVAT